MYACLKISFEEDLKMYLLKFICICGKEQNFNQSFNSHREAKPRFCCCKRCKLPWTQHKDLKLTYTYIWKPKKKKRIAKVKDSYQCLQNIKILETVFLGHACNSIWLELRGLAWLEIDGQVALLPSPSGIYHRQACWLD